MTSFTKRLWTRGATLNAADPYFQVGKPANFLLHLTAGVQPV